MNTQTDNAEFQKGYKQAKLEIAAENQKVAKLRAEKDSRKALREDLADLDALAEVTAIGAANCESVAENFASLASQEFKAFADQVGPALANETIKTFKKFATCGVSNFNNAKKRAEKVAQLADPVGAREAKRAEKAAAQA